MFTAVDYSNLGKSFFNYTNSYSKNTMDVSIVPVKNPDGNANYITLLDHEDDFEIPQYMQIEETPLDLFSQSDEPESYSEETKNQLSAFSIGDSSINRFYIGSVTVVGLFILFRLLQKTK